MFCKTMMLILLEENVNVTALTKTANPAIVKFTRRKNYEHVTCVKKDKNDLNPTGLNLPKGTRPYINDSFCPCYKGL